MPSSSDGLVIVNCVDSYHGYGRLHHNNMYLLHISADWLLDGTIHVVCTLILGCWHCSRQMWLDFVVDVMGCF